VSKPRLVTDSLNRRRRLVAVVLAAGALAAAGAVLGGMSESNPSCPPLSAHFDAADGGSLVLRFCGVVPAPLAVYTVTVSYDLRFRVGLDGSMRIR
jgi:hypothetical protein